MNNSKPLQAINHSDNRQFISYILGIRKTYRGKKLEEQLEIYQVPFEIQWGLEPEKDLVEIKKYRSEEFHQFVLRRGLSHSEMACALGHRKIYERFLESRYEWALVLEDDSEIKHNPSNLLLYLPKIPVPILINIHDSASIRMKKRNRARIIAPEIYLENLNFHLQRLNDAISGTYGYIINRKAAEELLKLKFKNAIGIADWPYGTSRKVQIFDLMPPLVIQRRGFDESIIGTRKSIKVKRSFRIPRPDRVLQGVRLGIPIGIAMHQEIYLKVSTLYIELKTKVSNCIEKKNTLSERKW